VLVAFTEALHPVLITAATLSVLAFGLTFLLNEIPLATSLRKEPEADLRAEEAAAASAVGGVTIATR